MKRALSHQKLCQTWEFAFNLPLSYKNWKQKTFFCQKMLIVCKKTGDISKIKEVLVLKSIFSETTYVCVLTLLCLIVGGSNKMHRGGNYQDFSNGGGCF